MPESQKLPENPTSVGSDHHTASSIQPLALSHAHLWALKIIWGQNTLEKVPVEVGAAPKLDPTAGSSHPARCQPETVSSERAHQHRVWFLLTVALEPVVPGGVPMGDAMEDTASCG